MRDAGYASAKKPLVFVAMPFHKTMKDVYIFGISRPANECGFICERADQVMFNDDIMKWVKERIAAADVVLADISGANANVYLEVGYAWGLRKETVLVIRHPEEPQFDLRSYRHFKYETIEELEKQVKELLVALHPSSAPDVY